MGEFLIIIESYKKFKLPIKFHMPIEYASRTRLCDNESQLNSRYINFGSVMVAFKYDSLGGFIRVYLTSQNTECYRNND